MTTIPQLIKSISAFLQRLVNYSHTSLGGRGTEYIGGTVTNEVYSILQVNGDAVFAVLTDEDDVNLMIDLGIASNTCAAGSVIKPKNNKTIKNITMASGSVWGIIKS